MQEPIQEFESLEQANEYLKEWQERLYLNDWIIELKLVDPDEIPDERGHNWFFFEKQISRVWLAKLTDILRTTADKCYQEITLVHELLHLKFNCIENEDTYEGKFLELHEHQLIEQMARSLIMAKYNLKPDWFKNI